MSPHSLAIKKKPLLQEVSKVAPGEAEWYQNQRAQAGSRRKNHPAEHGLHLLAGALDPKTQKLRHIINWAQKFLSKPPEEHGSKSPTVSLGFPWSNLCQSTKALGPAEVI